MGQRLPDTLKMLETAASEKPMSICSGGLDECVTGHRVNLLKLNPLEGSRHINTVDSG